MSTLAGSVKLNNFFIPYSYKLDVEVNLSTWSYRAREEIILMRNSRFVNEASSTIDVIQLHVGEDVNITTVEGATLVKRDEKSQTIYLKLDSKSHTVDRRCLTFTFDNIINTELRGFYRVTVQENGKQSRMASTHFEPTAARLFYICQDEPASRADFTLTVRLPNAYEEYTVLSNSKLRNKTVNANGQCVHEFDTISQCPPYLTACVIGKLDSISATTKSGIPVSVFTTPGKLSKAQFALRVTTAAVDYFENFFHCRYPLPKLDLVAVPDFPIGGMENWGCITCTEAILVDFDASGVIAMRRAAELLCHEVSHNWFGNLVAINWWEGLWLKEGFATWCGYYGAHEQYPEWGCLGEATRQVGAAMELDMSDYSHPVEVPIEDPAQITEIFDGISYHKGMGLVFMLQGFLGPKWEDAVAHYINKYQYKDTKTEQLWLTLEESSGVPVNDIMKSFVTQMGHPVVRVHHSAGHKGLILHQQPCKYALSAADCQATWCIPIIIENAHGQRIKAILRDREPLEVELPPEMQGENIWLTANPCRFGFYRCHYEDDQFQLWLSCFSSLKTDNKRTLIKDTFASLWMGQQEALGRVVALGKVLRDTRDHNAGVLMDFSDEITTFAACFEEEDKLIISSQLSFIVDLAQSLYQRCPKNAEEEILHDFVLSKALAMLLRGKIDTEASPLQETPVVKWAIDQAKSVLSGSEYSKIAVGKCLTAYMRFFEGLSFEQKSEQLVQKLVEEDGNNEICCALIEGLCMCQDTEFVKALAVRCMHNEMIRNHFGSNIFACIAANNFFQEGEVWRFFKDQFKDIQRQWGRGQFRIQTIVSYVGNTLSGTEANAAEFENFFKSHPLPNAKMAISRTVENIRLKSWMKNNWINFVVESFKKKL